MTETNNHVHKTVRQPVRMPNQRHGPRGAARFAPVEKPRQLGRTLFRLSGLFKEVRKSLFLVFALILADCALTLLIPYVIGLAINQIGTAADQLRYHALIDCLLVLVACYFSDAVLTLLQGWIMAYAGQNIVLRLRRSLFDKLQRLPIAFFDRHPHGDTMSRLTNDIENIDVTLAQSTVQLMNDVLMIVGTFLIMLWLSPLLTAASLITVPLVFLLTRLIASRTARLFSEQQVALGQLNSQIEESISGIDVVKAFNREPDVIRQFTETNQQLNAVGTKAQIWSGYLMPLMNVINNLGFASVTVVGGYLALHGMIQIGLIASFLTYSRQFTRPLNDIASIFNTLLSAVAGAERIFEILDQDEEIDAANAIGLPAQLANGSKPLSFDNVGFSYESGNPVLHDVTFDMLPGQQIALVGPTGAGKTTIVNLLTRFYDPTDGQIRLDGVSISAYKRADYRQLFGMVLQDPYLFRGTLLENIRYGIPGATREQVMAACKAAECDAFIQQLSEGYDTMIKENGSMLSEGQKQLLTIARALLKNPQILILDEATSHVDSRTEAQLQRAMNQLMKGRTSLIIAHRLSTIRHADKILVVSGGTIAEQGTHSQLLRQNGLYAALFRSQFGS
ncbi:MAG: ABC transporter ATP-binding protein [Sporolactobacillus sp.]